MRTAVISLLLSFVVGIGGAGVPQHSTAAPPRIPVLAELFTSEGCSSCPPADDLLRRLIHEQPVEGVEVIGISEHVDYWNRLGWVDPFSSHVFSRRQEAYARALPGDRVYTPQLVVDGRLEMVGSDRRAVRDALLEAAKGARASVSVASIAGGSGFSVSVMVRDVPAAVARHPLRVMVAIVEDDLESNVRRGENARRVLRHSAVARSIGSVGTLKRGHESGEFRHALAIDTAWNRDRLRIIAFVQDEKTLAVVGAASTSL